MKIRTIYFLYIIMAIIIIQGIDLFSQTNKKSTISQTWKDNGWMNTLRTTTFQNNAGLTDSILYENWNGSSWVLSRKSINEYNQDTLLTLIMTQRWAGGVWEDTLKSTYQYDANKNRTAVINQALYQSKWINDFKNEFEFDNNNFLLKRTSYNGNDIDWLPINRALFTYNSKGVEFLDIYQVYSNNSWVDYEKDSIISDANEYVTSIYYYYWNDTTKVWSIDTRSHYQYDANYNNTIYEEEYWNGNTWEKTYREEMTYNMDGLQLTDLDLYWDINEWVNDNQSDFSYDSNGDMYLYVYKIWDATFPPGEWVNSFRRFTEGSIDDVKDVLITKYNIRLYPNPASSDLNISYTLDSPQNVKIDLFNETGEIINKLVNSIQSQGENIFSQVLNKIPSGIYYLKVNFGEESFIEKVIVNR